MIIYGWGGAYNKRDEITRWGQCEACGRVGHLRGFSFTKDEPPSTAHQLVSRKTDIQQHTVNAVDAQVVKDAVQMAKVGMDQMNPRGPGGQLVTGVADGVLVLVDTDEEPVRGDSRADHAGVAGTPQCPVDDRFPGAAVQVAGHLGGHAGGVVAGHGLES